MKKYGLYIAEGDYTKEIQDAQQERGGLKDFSYFNRRCGYTLLYTAQKKPGKQYQPVPPEAMGGMSVSETEWLLKSKVVANVEAMNTNKEAYSDFLNAFAAEFEKELQKAASHREAKENG